MLKLIDKKIFTKCFAQNLCLTGPMEPGEKFAAENNMLKSRTINGVARMLKKLRTSKRDCLIKQWISSIASLFKMGTFLKGKNLLPECSGQQQQQHACRPCMHFEIIKLETTSSQKTRCWTHKCLTASFPATGGFVKLFYKIP